MSTDGVVSNDPLDGPAPVAASTPEPVWAPQPTAPDSQSAASPPAVVPQYTAPSVEQAPVQPSWNPVPVVTEPEKKGSPLKWILPVAAVVGVGAALFFLLGRGGDDGDGNAGLGVTEGEIVEGEAPTPVRVNLKAGEAIRVRLEPDDDIDTKVLVLVDNDLAEAWASGLFDVAEGEDGFFSDVDEVADVLFTDADDLVTDTDLGDLEDLISIASVDTGFEGDPDADFVPAFADGTYVLLPLAFNEGDESEYRLIVEKFDGTFDVDDDFSDIDEFFSEEDFFTDEEFFSDDGSFDPED